MYEMIEQLGVDLEYTLDLPPYRLGEYLDDERKIRIRANLTHTFEEEALYHEYAHALYRDRSCDPRLEHRALREAARLIIDPEAYARAEIVNPNPLAIARELDVTLHMIEVYQRAVIHGSIRLLEIA
ncbi:ImmA/IrrE family metallo-endopeptidase [Leifsonia aquatica]|uniref:ImmA/IrrE family metallo-endopeptidase n=1 Tax=Leifsonia aquatica TaxID=144185 RepID=UPI0013B4391D|nr:ImmA/IrrE family metallo-endopeptidase [Leifsonia aquatica]